jgi:hypothetical protein
MIPIHTVSRFLELELKMLLPLIFLPPADPSAGDESRTINVFFSLARIQQERHVPNVAGYNLQWSRRLAACCFVDTLDLGVRGAVAALERLFYWLSSDDDDDRNDAIGSLCRPCLAHSVSPSATRIFLSTFHLLHRLARSGRRWLGAAAAKGWIGKAIYHYHTNEFAKQQPNNR